MIRVEQVDPRCKDWMEIITRSHQGSLYTMPEWMELHPVAPFLAYRGNTVAGGVVASRGIMPPPFIPYQGLLLTRREDRDVAQALLSHVEQLPPVVSVWNPPSLVDIRPFTWRWYDANKLWAHQIRYTYYCDRDSNPERRAWTNITGAGIREGEDSDFFPEWSEQHWITDSDLGLMAKILSFSSVAIWTDKDGGFVVWGVDSHDRGYYLASVGKVTNIIHQLIKQHETSDLVGCNSPQRALFKRGFGGHLRTYYGMKLA